MKKALIVIDLPFRDEIVKANDVPNSFMSALGRVFCEVKNTKDITIHLQE